MQRRVAWHSTGRAADGPGQRRARSGSGWRCRGLARHSLVERTLPFDFEFETGTAMSADRLNLKSMGACFLDF